jgi:hypothetical protein
MAKRRGRSHVHRTSCLPTVLAVPREVVVVTLTCDDPLCAGECIPMEYRRQGVARAVAEAAERIAAAKRRHPSWVEPGEA